MGDAGPKTNPRNRGNSSPWMPRLRKRGEKLLHSKYVVILVIILTITDCALVIAELILDLYSVKKTLSATENQTFKFIRAVRRRYPDDIRPTETVASIYERVANATILWDSAKDIDARLRRKIESDVSPDATVPVASIGMGSSTPSADSLLLPFSEDQREGVKDGVNYDQTILVQFPNRSDLSEGRRRFRRSPRSNNDALRDNNEAGESTSNLVRLARSLRKLFSTGLSTTDVQNITDQSYVAENSTTTYNDSESADGDEGVSVDDYIDDSETGFGRYVDDLIFLQSQLSELFTMQLKDRLLNNEVGRTSGSAAGDTVSAKNDDVKTETLHFKPESDDALSFSNNKGVISSSYSAITNLRDGEVSVDTTLRIMDNSPSQNTSQKLSESTHIVTGSIQEEKDSQGVYDKLRPKRDSDHGTKTTRDGNIQSLSVRGYDTSDVNGSVGSGEKNPVGVDDSNLEEDMIRRELHHSKEMEIAHKLHYASLCVVSFLLVGVVMKIICSGSNFFKRKIQVFDAVVIIASFAVDLAFIKGLAEFAVDDSIFVLVFLLPWRVIRVVNSLVMAVIDHEHVKLRLLYSRKKKLDKTVETLKNESDELKGMLQDVRQFCIKEGIDASQIDGMLGKFAPRRRKDSKFYTLVKLVMSTASMNNNDNDSISSSSMENDLRHIATRDSVMNETGSNEGTISSLKQYLSVPFCSPQSHSISDIESLGGDLSVTSPSIFVTSPASDDGNAGFSFCDVDMETAEVAAGTRIDASESIQEEDESDAFDVRTKRLNSSPGVSFYVGSQTSLDFKPAASSHDNVRYHRGDANDNQSLGNAFAGMSSEGAHARFVDDPDVDDNRNMSNSQSYKKFLTVPQCAVVMGEVTHPESSASFGLSISNNNYNHNHNHQTEDGYRTVLSPAPSTIHGGQSGFEMRRSASDNVNVGDPSGSFPCKKSNLFFGSTLLSHHPLGSPVPQRRKLENRAKCKYTRSRSESEDKEVVTLLRPEVKARFRRHSGEPRKHVDQKEEAEHLGPHAHKDLLAIPGQNSLGNSVSYSSSRSMNDVSSAGESPGNNLGGDRPIMRRSCLSLNSDGRKRRAKTSHRVSFKVS